MIIILFILGLCIGSFLNVCMYRLPIQLSLSAPRSHCPLCETPLKPWDLIPLLSFLSTKGRCRYCHATISIQYFAIELTAGVLTLVAYSLLGLTPQFLVGLVLLYAGMVVIYIDFKHGIIPNKLNFFVGSCGLIYVVLLWSIGYSEQAINSLVGACLAGLLMLPLVLMGAWGAGDLKWMVPVGLLLGWQLTLLTLWLAILIGGFQGIWLLIVNKKEKKSEMPFGPSLVLGSWVSLCYGSAMIEWYFKCLH